MTQFKLFQGKKCVLCGRFFEPDARVGKRQQCCGPECRKKHKRRRDRVWRRKNPGYFQGRYEYVKTWREAHPGYQKARRCKKRREIQVEIPSKPPIKSMCLHLRCNLQLGEIQAQMLRVTQVGQAFWVDGATTQAA